jgi:hypothetical protein
MIRTMEAMRMTELYRSMLERSGAVGAVTVTAAGV